jgi:hypothetical protein
VFPLFSFFLAYVGCFRDEIGNRDLGEMVIMDETLMTPSFCEAQCGKRHQFKYFALQYGLECWCGNSYGKHPQAPDSDCNMACTGDSQQHCGAGSRNSVYEIKAQYQKPPPHPDGRPLLGLVMIVRNESHTLPFTLLSVKPFIDVYYILDTGSSDGTQDAIRRTLGADKGEVWEEPFIDYGRSRNRALEIAQTTKTLGGPPIFSLMLSADETLYNAAALREFCEEHRDKVGPQEEAYYVSATTPKCIFGQALRRFKYSQLIEGHLLRLAAVRFPWMWVGVSIPLVCHVRTKVGAMLVVSTSISLVRRATVLLLTACQECT